MNLLADYTVIMKRIKGELLRRFEFFGGNRSEMGKELCGAGTPARAEA
jgi:hypothetical protein